MVSMLLEYLCVAAFICELSLSIVKTSIDHMFIYVGCSLVYDLIGC